MRPVVGRCASGAWRPPSRICSMTVMPVRCSAITELLDLPSTRMCRMISVHSPRSERSSLPTLLVPLARFRGRKPRDPARRGGPGMAGDGRGWSGVEVSDCRGVRLSRCPTVEVFDRRGVRLSRCPTVADQVPRVDVFDRLSPSTEPGALSNAGSCPSVGCIRSVVSRTRLDRSFRFPAPCSDHQGVPIQVFPAARVGSREAVGRRW